MSDKRPTNEEWQKTLRKWWRFWYFLSIVSVVIVVMGANKPARWWDWFFVVLALVSAAASYSLADGAFEKAIKYGAIEDAGNISQSNGE